MRVAAPDVGDIRLRRDLRRSDFGGRRLYSARSGNRGELTTRGDPRRHMTTTALGVLPVGGAYPRGFGGYPHPLYVPMARRIPLRP